MREEAASYTGPPLTAEDDPPLTRLEKWLRLCADHPAHPAGIDGLVANHGQACNNLRTAAKAG